jgi:hypothetical protein
MPLNLRSSRRNAYRRAQTGPVEGLPSHLTTAAPVRLAFPRGPQDADEPREELVAVSSLPGRLLS